MQFLSLADLFFIPLLSGQNLCFILCTLLAPVKLFFSNFPRVAVNPDLYLSFCRGLTFVLTLDFQCQDLASPSEIVLGHQQVSPGCTLSEDTAATLLLKEIFACLQNTQTSTENSIFQRFPHLLLIWKHSQGKSTNQDQMYLLWQCWGAQVLKLPRF